MSAPRCVLAGTTYLITRRCSERRFFLKPSREVNSLVRYCLAYAAKCYGIELHAFCFLSNHYHLVVTDRRGHLPLFVHRLNLLIARALNARHARFESLWAPGSYSAVTLPDAETILEKISYTLANPVSAGLVTASHLWPGACSRPDDIGAPPQLQSRPGQFFRHDVAGALPERVQLELVVPPGFEGQPLTTVRQQVSGRLAEHEERARQARKGRRFLGLRQIRDQDVFDRPRDGDTHFGLNPRVAGRDPPTRIAALDRLRRFLRAYRVAWQQLRGGLGAQVVFPAGSWRWPREFGIACEAPS